ncbi:SCP2 sterol-binding domain-containing protein [Pasteurella skyensis]|uniref:Ubiquinone biosynthesis accessory factor UbiJ n=1 Tax=Phocoenobacter skyensis TaxID=97481 RepID=A0AAJ6P1J3_9PAST|nr:SCP2 sterol-binding domain-containing protein [Pasteurella skyensis]MDP8163409.1 SCP2 sterol-binding domain-containing protein [Pasteurella skyensis]MDP8170360.1 SCP2 sterol-binding domain-containing protein [Pasteurella skyensis]MDP8173700.1 SCP2 sterol-binding domain-containing protein [Pasteurella skyensis]MDP8174214.1 SCP2 sterol-binding domain-containing protein [Pasteurella skyensis]MDP8177832.1 SCP2 sterol-binding domain-containing protein [Pasteurella skyensis]
MLEELKQQLMLPQFVIAGIEGFFNGLIQRSPHCLTTLKKLQNSTLKIVLLQPAVNVVILFSNTQTNWLINYEDTPDCSITVHSSALLKLKDKEQLTKLINEQRVVLEGDIQVLQYFVQLLDELEKDPAELLSPLMGDVMAQSTTDVAKFIVNKVKQQNTQVSKYLVDNLMNEYPVLVHQLEIANFCDQVTAIVKDVERLERKMANF